MKYTIDIAGRMLEVEIDGDRIVLDGRPVEARLTGAKGSAIRRLVRGRSQRSIHVAEGDEKGLWQLALSECRLPVQVLAPRDLAIRKAGARKGGAAGGVLKAPMPGLVLRVLVEEGAVVEAGQSLVVVEAMKMENQLKARGPGTVKKVHVVAGAKVEKGAPLLEIE
jgi:biotin carboxyl carrier protein